MILRKKWGRALLIVVSFLLVAAAVWYAARHAVYRPEATDDSGDEDGRWIDLAPEGIISANGSPVTSRMRLGSESGKVIVLFYGGGISINEYMAAHPFTSTDFFSEDGFYAADIQGIIPDLCDEGLGSRRADNPFRNWTLIVIPYTTADYHIGTTDYAYTDEDGNGQILHHHGYTNFRAIMDEASAYLDAETDELLIAGTSAGGFGASMLAGEIVEDYFPGAKHVTVCIDSAFQYYGDWETVAREIWGAPETITQIISSPNLVVDFLAELIDVYGDRLSCLYIGSVRDGSLTKYQAYLNGLAFDVDSGQGLLYMRDFSVMLRELRQTVPNIGVYLFDYLPYSDQWDQAFLTQHTILLTEPLFWPMTDGIRPVDWLMSAVEGDVADHGLELFE